MNRISDIVERIKGVNDQNPTGKRNGDSLCDWQKKREAEQWHVSNPKYGIPCRYYGCTLQAIETMGIAPVHQKEFEAVKAYAAVLEEHVGEGTGLLLKGPVGTMKTSLAVAVAQAALEKRIAPYFVKMSSLLDNIFTYKAINQEEWVRFEHRLRESPLLIVDDLGAEYSEGWVNVKVDAIISERYDRCRSTIITTNLGNEQLKQTYAARIIDRLRSTMKELTFIGPSLRKSVK